MATTISKLNYMLTVDASGLDKGLQASRREVSQMKRAMRELQTPMERYETALEKAKPLLKLGAEGQELYNRAMAKAAERLKQERDAAWKASKAYKALQMAKQAVAGIVVGVVAGTIATVKRDLQEIDKLAKAATRLNIELEELTALQFTVSTTSGLTSEQTLKGLEKMVRRVSEAAAGTGEAKASLDELGLSAEQLNRLSPDQMFKAIADEMAKVSGEANKLRLATKIFDDEQAGIFTTLQRGTDYIDHMNNRAKELGMVFDKMDASKVEAANDAMLELNTALTAFSREFTISIAPSLRDLIVEMTELISTFRQEQIDSQSAITADPVSSFMDYVTAFSQTTREQSELFTGGDIGDKSILPFVRIFENVAEIEFKRSQRQTESIFLRGQELNKQKEKEILDIETKKSQQIKQSVDFLDTAKDGIMTILNQQRSNANAISSAIGLSFAELTKNRANNFRGLDQWIFGGSETTTKTSTVDVMSSVAAGSAEAFKLEFRRTVKQDEQLKQTHRIADATEGAMTILNDLLQQIMDIKGSNIT